MGLPRVRPCRSRTDLDRVALDLHPAAAAVAELAPRHVAVERLAVELEPGGQALDDRDQAGAVRFAGGCEPESHARERRWRTTRRPGLRVAGHRDQGPEGEERGERDRRDRAPSHGGRAAPAPRPSPAAKATTIASITAAPEVDAEHPGELHVAEAHALRADQRRREQKAARAEPRDQSVRHRARVGQQRTGKAIARLATTGGASGTSLVRRSLNVTTAEQSDERGVEQRGGHIVESRVTPEPLPDLMAARRLLIVMLILLGLSTLAAALVPQHALRRAEPPGARPRGRPRASRPRHIAEHRQSLTAEITVGGGKIPVVAAAV